MIEYPLNFHKKSVDRIEILNLLFKIILYDMSQ